MRQVSALSIIAARVTDAVTAKGAWRGPDLKDNIMKKILAAAFVTALTVSAAYAAEVEGVVKAVDPATGAVMLESGETFQAAAGVSLVGVAPGATVQVSYADGTTEASAIIVK